MTTAKGHAPAARNDAIATLTADHKKVKDLFKQFEKLKDKDDVEAEKGSLVDQICTELTIHTTIEEEIFYPSVREKIGDESLMDEALVEHAEAKDLIAQLKDVSPDDDLYDAKVTVLGEQIDHHVKEEEREMFPKAKKAEADTEELGALMAQRRMELEAEFMQGEEEDDERNPAKPGISQPNNEKRTRSV